MRLDTVVPNVGRELQAPMKIAGHDLPKGVVLAPCIYLTHRRADLWPEPEKFNPTRFLDARPNPYAFFPFGGGTRRCIGAAFATYQMKVVLSELLRSVELAPGSVVRRQADPLEHRARAIRGNAGPSNAAHYLTKVTDANF